MAGNNQNPKFIPPHGQVMAGQSYFLACGGSIAFTCVIICFIWWSERNYGVGNKISKAILSDLKYGRNSARRNQENKNLFLTARFRVRKPIKDKYLKKGPYLKLIRTTEYYPWRKNSEDSRTKVRTRIAKKVTYGGYRGKDVFNSLLKTQVAEDLILSPKLLKKPRLPIEGKYIYLRSTSNVSRRRDRRISYKVIRNTEYTLVGKQKKKHLVPLKYIKHWSNQFMLISGKYSPQALIDVFVTQKRFYNYIFRLYGTGFLWLSFCFFFLPFQGSFRLFGFLSNYTRILPLLFAVPTAGVLILTSYNTPTLRTLMTQLLSYCSLALLFIHNNKA